MRKLLLILMTIAILACGTALIGCSDDDDNDTSDTAASGTLNFVANGEDFVREGFVSKDGWSISFDHVYITLSDITAYQTNPPYDAHDGDGITGDVEAELPGNHTIDLAEGPEDAAPISVGQLINVETGHYNAISWTMGKAASGSSAGHCLQMIGTAAKDGQVKDFTLNIDAVCQYDCGEYVGDERQGILTNGGTAELEMTFHFDHIFGDAGTPADEGVNPTAPGFDYFLDYLDGRTVEIDMAEFHLGHVGEGHCHCECE